MYHMNEILRQTRARRVFLARLSSALVALGAGGAAVAQTTPPVTPPPPMTIQIFNNSCKVGACPGGQKPYNIYPVLSTGTSAQDQLLQAVMGVPSGQVGKYPYPKLSQYRLYLNPTGNGIPPGGSLTLSFPVYTQLVPTGQINPSLPDQLIDWWNGGRIELFDGDATTGVPPAALTADYTGTNKPNRAKQVEVTSWVSGTTIPALTSCIPGPCQSLKIFRDPAGLTNNEPTQLTEYTLGALQQNVPPNLPYGVDYHNVDYDVSYVDAAYLPAAMEPFNNPVVGYIGSIQSIDPFKAVLTKFLKVAYPGWPQFSNEQHVTILKVPSPIDVFPKFTSTPPYPDLTPQPPWAPFTALINQWNACNPTGTGPLCPNIQALRKLIVTNYTFCTNLAVTPATEPLIISHAYGWTPFNTAPGASPAAPCVNQPSVSHLLQDTPGYFVPAQGRTPINYAAYQRVKEQFDALQYWPNPTAPNGLFDPYLLLIHGADYINTDRAYAYSVDDALGNMQVEGDGLIIAVGGTNGLPNPNKATSPINIQFGYDKTAGAINFVKYGACTNTPNKNVNPNYASFAISSTDPQNCPISFLDSQNRVYHVTIKQSPPFPLGPPDPTKNIPSSYYPSYIDCSGNMVGSLQAQWCRTPAAPNPNVAYGVWVQTIKGLFGSGSDFNYVQSRGACAATHC
jgi:hypothetical protein